MAISTRRKLYQFVMPIAGGAVILLVAVVSLIPLRPVAATAFGSESSFRPKHTAPISDTLTVTLFLPLVLKDASSPPPPTPVPTPLPTPTPPPAPDFSLAVSPATQTVAQGDETVFTASLTAINGFSAPVTLSAAELPAGIRADFAPNPVTPTARSILTLTTAVTSPTGTHHFTVQAVSGSDSHTATAEISLAPMPQPDLAVQSLSVPLTPTSGLPFTATVVVQNRGTFSVTAPFSVAFFVELPSPPQTHQWVWNVDALGISQTVMLSHMFAITPTGVHTFFAQVDTTAAIAESDEQNNLSTALTATVRRRAFDLAFVLDRSGSMEFDPVCYGCWERRDRLDPTDPNYLTPADTISDTPRYGRYTAYPQNGVIYPLGLSAGFSDTNRIKVCTTDSYTPAPAVYTFSVTDTVYQQGGSNSLIIEAELYAANSSVIDTDLQEQGKGYWAFQRGEGNYSSESTPYYPSQGTSIDGMGAHMAHHPSVILNGGYGRHYTFSDAQLGDAPWLEYDFQFYDGIGNGWTAGQPAYVWVRVHPGRGLDYDSGFFADFDPDAAYFSVLTATIPTDFPSRPAAGDVSIVPSLSANDWQWVLLGNVTVDFSRYYRLYFFAGSAGYSIDRIVVTDAHAQTVPGDYGTAAAELGGARTATATVASAYRTACDYCNEIFGENITDPAAQCTFPRADYLFPDFSLGLVEPRDNASQPIFDEWEMHLRDVKESAKSLVRNLQPARDQIGLTYFSTSGINSTPLTCQRAAQTQGIPCVSGAHPYSFTEVLKSIEDMRAQGGTPTAYGMHQGLQVLGIDAVNSDCDGSSLSSCARGDEVRKAMILVTDGLPNATDWQYGCTDSTAPAWRNPDNTAAYRCPLYFAAQAAQQDMRVYVVGIGYEIDRDWLGEVARFGHGRVYFSAGRQDADAILDDIFADAVRPDFDITVIPAQQTVAAGGETVFTATLSARNGFTQPVTLSIAELPAGIRADFAPNPVTPTARSMLTITVASTTSTGLHHLALHADSPDGIAYAVDVSVQVE